MNPWFLLGATIAVAAAGAGGLYKGRALGMAEVQQAWDNEKTQQYEAYAVAQDAARLREQALQASANNLRKDKDAEIRNLNARATALANSLRERPSRPTTESSPVPGTASVGPAPASCTGAGLSREDAEFLAGEATRADELRASLRQCLAQYSTLIPK
ncbi:hypothetical protein UFOVP682_46 [uncultured Caudovirales phage]|uniref:Uncharacterized protein n=1 Tax=uncultured Caudovirales phage TaxID=2100421 RepID=A0A6J5NG23_9CAUD|nr:hypothetical protein UFOVP682_46 [uncultured Caudovirales phage]